MVKKLSFRLIEEIKRDVALAEVKREKRKHYDTERNPVHDSKFLSSPGMYMWKRGEKWTIDGGKKGYKPKKSIAFRTRRTARLGQSTAKRVQKKMSGIKEGKKKKGINLTGLKYGRVKSNSTKFNRRSINGDEQ